MEQHSATFTQQWLSTSNPVKNDRIIANYSLRTEGCHPTSLPAVTSHYTAIQVQLYLGSLADGHMPMPWLLPSFLAATGRPWHRLARATQSGRPAGAPMVRPLPVQSRRTRGPLLQDWCSMPAVPRYTAVPVPMAVCVWVCVRMCVREREGLPYVSVVPMNVCVVITESSDWWSKPSEMYSLFA